MSFYLLSVEASPAVRSGATPGYHPPSVDLATRQLANAAMDCWVGSVRRDCLDRLLIVGRRQLEHVLRVYARHYNRRRPHRALDLKPPDEATHSPIRTDAGTQALQVRRRELLGGLIQEYESAVAA